METHRPTPRPAALEAHLGYWMRRVSNAVSGGFAQALRARDCSTAEWVLLRVLWERGHDAPAGLAEALGMTRGAVSKIVTKAEAKGWVESRPDPADGRAQQVSLTARGRRLVPDLAARADHNDQAFFGCLTAKERLELRRLLVKLTGHNRLGGVPVD